MQRIRTIIGRLGICRSCHKPYEIYKTWNGRSHICSKCRTASNEKKMKNMFEKSLGFKMGEVSNDSC